jgi:hypothetical protein
MAWRVKPPGAAEAAEAMMEVDDFYDEQWPGSQ